ncbi:MAG: hypothetical protein WA160_06130 [Pseudobdellovibrio sp.]
MTPFKILFLILISLNSKADEVDDLFKLMSQKTNLLTEFDITAKTILLTNNLIDKKTLNMPEAKDQIKKTTKEFEKLWKSEIRKTFTKKEITYLNKLYQSDLMVRLHANTVNLSKNEVYKNSVIKSISATKESKK